MDVMAGFPWEVLYPRLVGVRRLEALQANLEPGHLLRESQNRFFNFRWIRAHRGVLPGMNG